MCQLPECICALRDSRKQGKLKTIVVDDIIPLSTYVLELTDGIRIERKASPPVKEAKVRCAKYLHRWRRQAKS